MQKIGRRALCLFEENLESVERLVNFDRLVLEFSISSLETLQERLASVSQNPRHQVKQTIQQLHSIRDNDSLRSHYQEIFNQCVVLQVSYFASAAADIVRECVPKMLAGGQVPAVLGEEIKLSVGELYNLDRNQLGDLILRKRNISFQDMKSTRDAFEDFLGITTPKDADMNNIICGQACRNVIVHDGSRVNDRLLAQLENALPRTLKVEIGEEKRVIFSPEEVKQLAKSMSRYLSMVVSKLPEIDSTCEDQGSSITET